MRTCNAISAVVVVVVAFELARELQKSVVVIAGVILIEMIAALTTFALGAH